MCLGPVASVESTKGTDVAGEQQLDPMQTEVDVIS
jgi:hypothetical protein